MLSEGRRLACPDWVAMVRPSIRGLSATTARCCLRRLRVDSQPNVIFVVFAVAGFISFTLPKHVAISRTRWRCHRTTVMRIPAAITTEPVAHAPEGGGTRRAVVAARRRCYVRRGRRFLMTQTCRR